MLHKIQREVNAMRLLAFETARVVDQYQHHQARLEKSGMEDREIRRDDRVKAWAESWGGKSESERPGRRKA